MKMAQLFLLHFAGGNCYSFTYMRPLLKEFDVISLELPGRGKRSDEGLLKDFDLAAADIYDQITQKLVSSTFIIYGHSMGAYLALRVSHMLEKAGTPPAYLIVSGNTGPGRRDCKNDQLKYLMGRADFKEELKLLGGIPEELLNNEEVFDLFEPILRADFEITEGNERSEEPAVNSPLYAMMGDQEEKVNEITNWARYTKSGFQYEILEGGHFFIYKHPERIAAVITDCFRHALPLTNLIH